jgi:Zn-dependent peptidase ImmA (M78 family)
MDRQEQYEKAKSLAREKRLLYLVHSETINLSCLRKIYSQEGIKIKLAEPKRLRKLKAAYFNDENGIDVFLNPKLPNEAKLFALVHELKHHYVDANGEDVWSCLKSYGEEPLIEKTAEVFAAEFIWPENDFFTAISDYGITKENCSAENVIGFKRAIKIPVSYTFIKKRLEWFRLIDKGSMNDVKFQTLEHKMYGLPFYLRR